MVLDEFERQLGAPSVDAVTVDRDGVEEQHRAKSLTRVHEEVVHCRRDHGALALRGRQRT